VPLARLCQFFFQRLAGRVRCRVGDGRLLRRARPTCQEEFFAVAIFRRRQLVFRSNHRQVVSSPLLTAPHGCSRGAS
jgi:hypothetical protein